MKTCLVMILVKKVFIFSKTMIICLLCPLLCGLFFFWKVAKGELSYNKLCLNVQTHECLLDGEPVSLTPTEFSILQVLLESAGNVVSIEELFHAVWKDEYYSKNSSTITVHIRHLREKLNDTSDTPQYIKTIWGVGYKI